MEFEVGELCISFDMVGFLFILFWFDEEFE